MRIVTAEGETLYANRSLLRLYGYSTIDELGNIPVSQRYTTESYAEHLERKDKRRQGIPVPSDYEINIICKDGKVRCLRVYRSEVIWSGQKEFHCIYEDITESKQAQDRLEVLSHRLLQAQEEERRNLALELHDEIGQSLNALKLTLDRQTEWAEGDLKTFLRESSKMTGEILEQVRQFSLELRPKMLDDLGLLSTLVWYFSRYSERTKVKVDFKHSGINRTFGRDLSGNVYRIVQQALTNIARHASVDRVIVRAQAEQDVLMIQIEDKGLGFDMANLSISSSSGIEGMRERARLLGGTLTIDSAPGHGTRLLLEVPLKSHLAGL